MTTVCVNQPYYFPYAGYFGLIDKCDLFVVYDNVKFTKGGWINRNRILSQGSVLNISLPLQKASDYSQISERRISPSYDPDKLLRSLEGAYRNAANWGSLRDSLPALLQSDRTNLFDYLFETLQQVCNLLQIQTTFVRASEIVENSANVSGLDRLLRILEHTGATEYINLPGGRTLYNKKDFEEVGVRLGFADFSPLPYSQVGLERLGQRREFIESLSIIDVVANLGLEATHDYVLAASKTSWVD